MRFERALCPKWKANWLFVCLSASFDCCVLPRTSHIPPPSSSCVLKHCYTMSRLLRNVHAPRLYKSSHSGLDLLVVAAEELELASSDLHGNSDTGELLLSHSKEKQPQSLSILSASSRDKKGCSAEREPWPLCNFLCNSRVSLPIRFSASASPLCFPYPSVNWSWLVQNNFTGTYFLRACASLSKGKRSPHSLRRPGSNTNVKCPLLIGADFLSSP